MVPMAGMGMQREALGCSRSPRRGAGHSPPQPRAVACTPPVPPVYCRTCLILRLLVLLPMDLSVWEERLKLKEWFAL